jgi:hypothetical protein
MILLIPSKAKRRSRWNCDGKRILQTSRHVEIRVIVTDSGGKQTRVSQALNPQ